MMPHWQSWVDCWLHIYLIVTQWVVKMWNLRFWQRCRTLLHSPWLRTQRTWLQARPKKRAQIRERIRNVCNANRMERCFPRSCNCPTPWRGSACCPCNIYIYRCLWSQFMYLCTCACVHVFGCCWKQMSELRLSLPVTTYDFKAKDKRSEGESKHRIEKEKETRR